MSTLGCNSRGDFRPTNKRFHTSQCLPAGVFQKAQNRLSRLNLTVYSEIHSTIQLHIGHEKAGGVRSERRSERGLESARQVITCGRSSQQPAACSQQPLNSRGIEENTRAATTGDAPATVQAPTPTANSTRREALKEADTRPGNGQGSGRGSFPSGKERGALEPKRRSTCVVVLVLVGWREREGRGGERRATREQVKIRAWN